MGNRRGAYRVFMGTPEGKWPLVRRKPRWDGYIKINLQKVG